jgi:steroid 5-alpha reductase family enzyme
MDGNSGNVVRAAQDDPQQARVPLATLPVVLAIGAAFAVAGSQGGAKVGAIPVFALCVGLAFAVQWVAFVPAFLLQTERFYDITGSLTFVTLTLVAVVLAPAPDARSFLLLAMVVVWASRLGSYLFRRVLRSGGDSRFDAIKPSFARFLTTWTLQGLWVVLTLGAALAAITTDVREGLGLLSFAGLGVWCLGLAFEAVADAQKSRFRADPRNRGDFIRTGLWAWSRHPNYFGEIVLWVGVALVAVPVLHGWQWVTLVSPVFVFLLITRVSGVPLLEKSADERWGGREDYESYKARTPVLVPLLRPAGGGGPRR